MNFTNRIKRLIAALEEKGLDSAMVLSPENIFYLTGAPFIRGGIGKILLVESNGSTLLIVTELDYEEVNNALSNTNVEIVKTEFGERPIERLEKSLSSNSKVGYEEGIVSAGLLERISNRFTVQPLKGVIERMREVKEWEELSLIEHAQAVNDKALERVLPNLKEGMSELEIAAELEYMLRREGCEAYAFETIVASGPRGVFPHGIPSRKIAEGGEPVIIDFGAKFGGYCSDMTRTIFFGDPPTDTRMAYQAVMEAQEAGIERVADGIGCREIDGAAREVINGKGYGRYFVHGLGHGVGIEIHEAPTVGWSNTNPVLAGSVITIEPGVYIPKRFGIRIEDLVVVEKDRAKDLTKFTRELITI